MNATATTGINIAIENAFDIYLQISSNNGVFQTKNEIAERFMSDMQFQNIILCLVAMQAKGSKYNK